MTVLCGDTLRMNRRNVLIGLTAAATGSSVVFGSGAFTQVQADRSLTIGVSEDDSALLALDAGDNVASVYNSDNEGQNTNNNGTGELVIDTTELSSSNEGFNVGANVQIGRTVDESGNTVDFADTSNIGNNDNVVTKSDDDAAFKLTNNFESVPGGNNNDIKVTIDTSQITPSGSDGDGDGTLDASLYFIGTRYSSGSAQETEVAERSSGETKGTSDYTMSHDDEVYFAIYIDTDATTNPDNFTGSVTISAEPNQEQ